MNLGGCREYLIVYRGKPVSGRRRGFVSVMRTISKNDKAVVGRSSYVVGPAIATVGQQLSA
jgi:hypothetical protein